MKIKLLYGWVLLTLILLVLPTTALAADNPPGVSYRGHIQDVGDYPADGSWVASPEMIGTTGQSKRIEGFEIKLTGDIPTGMELRYNVHVQNKGWLYDENDSANWPKNGDYAGTRGESLRIEAVKIVLTDSDGKAVPGYSVQYRGHVQNVGNLPEDETKWIKDGDQLGTVGSSLRLEALLVQVVKTGTDPIEPVQPVVYDTAGIYGPETGTEVINGDVIVKADGVTLRNLHINGDLYIGTEQVVQKADESTAATINEDQINTETSVLGYSAIELQQLYVEYFTRPAAGTSLTITGSQPQAFAFSLPGGTQFTATTPGGSTATALPMEITVGSSGGSDGGISVGGTIGSLSLLTPGTQVSVAPGSLVQQCTLQLGALNCGITTAATAVIQSLLVQGPGAVFAGSGPILHADIQANGAIFATRPDAFTMAPGVAMPSMPAPPSGGGGGGDYTPTQTAVSFNVPGGEVAMPASVTLTSTGADVIYYTTDGSNPSTVSGAPNTIKVTGDSATITINQAITVKALAVRAGYIESAVSSASYTQIPSADLTGINISPATDNFSFVPTTYDYPNVTVANDVEGITITPSGSGVITVDGTPVLSGTTVPIAVSFKQEKTINVTTQEPGKALKTYTIMLTPSSGTVTPIVSTLKSDITVTDTTLDLNASGIFGIKPGSSGVLADVEFFSSDLSVIDPSMIASGIIPILKDTDGPVTLTFSTARVNLAGINYDNISLNYATIIVTVKPYLTKVNNGAATVTDYVKAGITGVVAENLAGINAAVVAAKIAAGTDLNKVAVQNVVDTYLTGANSFAIAFEKYNAKIQTEEFNLSITNAKDSYGNLLNGDRPVTVYGSQNSVVYDGSVTFTNGTAVVPSTLSQIGAYTLTVNVNGITIPQTLPVTVYSKLIYDSDAANTVIDYDEDRYGQVVAIPPDNQGTSVTIIKENAFKSKGLTSVTMPDGIVKIGLMAFMGNNLTSVIIPASVVDLEDRSFDSNQLTNVVIQPDQINIMEGVFSQNSITSITIGKYANIAPTQSNFIAMGTYGDAFVTCYEYNDKPAGTYVFSDSIWTRQ